MPLSEQALRAIEIANEITTLENELNELVRGGGIEEETLEPKKKRKKYTHRIKPEKNEEESVATVSEEDDQGQRKCCGTWKFGRHKKDCPLKKGNATTIKTEKEEEGEEVEERDEEVAVNLRCGSCEHKFFSKLTNAFCPECQGTDIYQLYD